MMKKSLLFIFALPLLLSGCNKNEEKNSEYKMVTNEDIVELQRQHQNSLHYLNTYTYSYHHEINAKDLYLDKNIAESTIEDINKNIGIYRDVFVTKESTSKYIGNNTTVGSKDTNENEISYWFINAGDNIRNLAKRVADTNRDQQQVSEDEIIKEDIKKEDTEYYFSARINDPEYSQYFNDSITALANPINLQISENEIVSKGYEIKKIDELKNLDFPNDQKMNLIVFSETTTITKYSYISEINSYVCSEKSETYNKFIITDNALNTLKEKNILESYEKHIKFSYSASPLPYSGTPFFFKENDQKQIDYAPVLVSFDETNNEYIEEMVNVVNITNVYRNQNTSFKGYAYSMMVQLEKDAYCISTRTQFDNEIYEVLGFSNIIENSVGYIGQAGIQAHPNLFKNYEPNVGMEIIITIDVSATNIVTGGLIFRAS